jgi:hypothetical protein
MSKQTAVEWLQEAMSKKLSSEIGPYFLDLFEQAKAMEKEQIIYAFGQGSLFDPVFPDQFHYRADDYYQHHYGQ